MIKFKEGYIKNNETGEQKDVIVKSVLPANVRDLLIGGGIVLVGIAYLTVLSFKKGARTYEQAEYDTLDSLDLFKDSPN